ncbi:MAG: LPXTG cell wall anchor domain-containing protein [Defluviitaleaceae bacterium]|nr:LPXTG cell wall anchor domain-containing protein [Defluviitaleaceae bacterium]
MILNALRFALAGTPSYVLPLTGGAGPLVVTAIGIGLAVLSLLLFFLRGKSDNKKKKPRK